SCLPPGYIDGNTSPASTPNNDVGPGWGWAAHLLPFMEQEPLFRQINFTQAVGAGVNVPVSQQGLTIFRCPSDGLQQAVPIYDSNFDTPVATVAHANYVACVGWEECFYGAGGDPQPGPGDDGLSGLYGQAGRGAFYRNSKVTMSQVTDGLSNTVFAG